MTPLSRTLTRLSTAKAALFLCLSVLVWSSVAQVRPSALTLAVADLPSFVPVLVAEAQGYFKDEGLGIRVIHCPNGKRCLKHLTDGEAHVATVADTPLVFASLEGKPFSVIATMTTSSRETRLIALKARGIQEPKDLKGKRLGVVLGTTAHYYLDSFLLFHGIAPSQTTIVGLDAKNAYEALVRGEVDAAALYQPHVYQATQALAAKALALPNPKFLSMSINLVSAVQDQSPSHAQFVKLLRAIERANLLITDDPTLARRLVLDKLPMDALALATIWPDYDFGLRLGQPLVAALESQARWATRSGLVANRVVPDYLDYINLAPLLEVRPRSVTLVK